MSKPPTLGVTRTFVAARLPWVIGTAALVLYLVTLNHWISIEGLGTVARVSGWLWRPKLEQPLTAAVLFPFRFLPVTWIPLALNLFNAVCAALVLVLLARSVSLLPHDVAPREPFPQPGAPNLLGVRFAWLAPVLAALLLGLQLTFWENATSASAAMLDLLLMAYVIRCLLEFRLDQKESWLLRSVFLYAAGMVNNWALIAFMPVFVVGLVRVKTYGEFIQKSFLRRIGLWAVAGLGFYLLLPIVEPFSSHGQVALVTVLKAQLKSQWEMLSNFRRPSFRALIIASLLPPLVLSIRWKSHSIQSGEDTRLGVLINKTSGHLLHAFCFLSALWLAFDPSFSPRHLALGTPMLTYYYLAALVFGYCAGYFLLFGRKPPPAGPAPGTALAPAWTSLLATGLGLLLLCALPVGLSWRNLEQIRTTNGPWLRQLAEDLYADLPVGKSVVLSDDPAELLLLRAAVNRQGIVKDTLLLEAPALFSAQYNSYLARRYPGRWPQILSTNVQRTIGPGKILTAMASLAQREKILYLHPSLGLFFEFYQAQPSGCVYPLTPISPGMDPAPRSQPSSKLVAANERAWNQRWTHALQHLALLTTEKPKYPPGDVGRWLKRLYLAAEPNLTATFVGAGYSRRLNEWGVESQRLGRLPEAARWFQRAVELDPANLAARINREYAERLQRGDRTQLNLASFQNEFLDEFTKYASWRDLLDSNGPVDEPSALFQTGRVLLAAGNNRQAIAAFARSAELAPDWPAPRLWLAQAYLRLADFTNALLAVDSFREPLSGMEGVRLARLLECRTLALRGLGRTNEAALSLESFVKDHHRDSEVLIAAAELYSQNNQFAESLALFDELLTREPRRADLLARKGLVQVQLSKYQEAIATLTEALALEPKNEDARLMRAIAYLGAQYLEASRADYEELLKTAHPRNALFGLGTIAWRQQDTNTARRYYQQYLLSGPMETRQDIIASERLKELGGAVR